jgi:hypothetical protein
MSVAAGIHVPVNGLSRRATNVNESREYEKILSIYSQVIAGDHPRLRLSAPVNHLAQTGLEQHSSHAPTTEAAPSAPESAPPPQLPGLQFGDSIHDLAANTTSLNGPSVSSRPLPPKPPTSELDPIFLTKSDDLVRAEIHLQRQRVERVLREQVEQKRVDARHKPPFAEAKPEFDVPDVLTKALALVKPVAFDEPRVVHHENGSTSDSFDENSFYSSKAPDSTPHDGNDSQKSSSSKHQVQNTSNDEPDADRHVDRRSDEMQQVDLTDSPYKVIPRPAFAAASNQHYRREAVRGRGEGATRAPVALDENDDEPEYSPPEPAQPVQLKGGRNATAGETHAERGRHPSGRHGNQYQNTRRYESPMDTDVRIVRSHITSPIAPQPSRVSPLAVAKGPPISQNRRHRQEYGQQRRMGGAESERPSPDIAAPATQPRKKRKLQDGRKGGRKRAIGSPDPIIKDEPVSPPPFHDVPPLGSTRNRQAAERPIYIDVEPLREAHYTSERRPEPSARQVIYDVQGQTTHSAPRTLSRSGFRDDSRVNADARRVVSVQNLPARDFVEPAYPTPTRLSRAPFAVDEGSGRYQDTRPLEGQPRTYERPQIVEDLSLASPPYRNADPDHRYAVPPMAPPPQRRIVVDEYGQRFYETVQPPRASVAVPPARRVDMGSYNEVATIRNGPPRATSVFEEPHGETRYVQEMGPPQMVYRRVAEAPRPVTSDLRYVTEATRPAPTEVRYVTREPVEARPGQRSGSVQMYEHPARPPGYLDHQISPRESIMRVSSVRPASRHYEKPQEMYQRVGSVRPEARQLSVYPEDFPQARTEHVPVEGPRYEIRRTAEADRYYRIDDGGRVMVDGAVEARPAYATRY